MGFISYYRAFIPEFSAITGPLTDPQRIQKLLLEDSVWSFQTCMISLLSKQMLLIMVRVLSFYKKKTKVC